MKNIISIIFALIFMFLAFSTDSDDSYSSDYDYEYTEWYEGGNLHRKKIIDWKNATYENKLATCADFIVSNDNNLSLSQAKPLSINLVHCIDSATEGLNETNNLGVAEIASLCIIQMGY